MSDSRPDHSFVGGVCPACINAQNKPNIDWEQRGKDLDILLDRFHGECIVPSSGGKDSTYQAITLKEMGAHVTAATARTCHLTDVGRKNIDNLAKHVRTVEYVPNMTVRAKLNKLGLQLVGDISWPEHAAIFSTPFHASKDFNIPLVMYGESPQMEYGGPEGSEQARQMTARWRSEFGGFLGLRPSDFVGMEGITARDMKDYELPEGLMDTEAHFLGQYIEWDSHRNAEVAKEHGMICVHPFEGNWWEAENQDNAQTGIHDYFMYLKYGYSRGTTQISVDVRNGLVSRDDALEWCEVSEPIFPEVYMGVWATDILERIGLNRDEFDHHHWFGNGWFGNWNLWTTQWLQYNYIRGTFPAWGTMYQLEAQRLCL